MIFEEIDEYENINIFYGSDACYDYWALQADPRYQEGFKQFLFEQACDGDY